VNNLIVDKVTFSEQSYSFLTISLTVHKVKVTVSLKKMKKCEPDEHVILLSFVKKRQPDGISSGCYFQNKMRTG